MKHTHDLTEEEGLPCASPDCSPGFGSQLVVPQFPPAPMWFSSDGPPLTSPAVDAVYLRQEWRHPNGRSQWKWVRE